MQIGLANFSSPYLENQILCNISDDASSNLTMYRGVYQIRGQAAGGGGSNNVYWHNGGSGGGGAAFEGELRIPQNLSTLVTTKSGGARITAGGNTEISEVITMIGGGPGGVNPGVYPGAAGRSDQDPGGPSGPLLWNNSIGLEIGKFQHSSPGNPGNSGSNPAAVGANSILTNTGGGNETDGSNAFAPGAGGSGGRPYWSGGGSGGKGEIKITYQRAYLTGVNRLIPYVTPTLTGSTTHVTEGDIIVTSSYNDTVSWNGRCQNFYVMRNSVSTVADTDYWQMNGSNAQWLEIKFPYSIIITGLNFYTRPKDNYKASVSCYTDSGMNYKIGNTVKTIQHTSSYTLASDINILTNTLFIYITDMDPWFGMQNLQIYGFRDKSSFKNL